METFHCQYLYIPLFGKEIFPMEDFFQCPNWQLVFWEPAGHRERTVFAFSMHKITLFS